MPEICIMTSDALYFVCRTFVKPVSTVLLASKKNVDTFTAKIDHSRFNNSCLRLPASTSVHLVDVIFIPFIVYYAYVAI
jgi:hypothetical protein